MRILIFVIAIFLILPLKAQGVATGTAVEPLLLYKANQDKQCRQW